MGQSFLEFAKTGLHKAMQNGADHAELFVVKGRSFEVELKNNHIDDMKQWCRAACAKRWQGRVFVFF